MDFKIEENRIYIENEEGKILAEIEYEKKENNKYSIYHTFVDEVLRGQGIASKLVEKAVAEIKKKGRRACCNMLLCKSMARKTL